MLGSLFLGPSSHADTIVVPLDPAFADLVDDSVLTTFALMWTAVGDDSTDGIASFYDLRYRDDSPISNDSTFYLGTVIPTQSPDTSGTREMYIIQLPVGTYYFAMKVADDIIDIDGRVPLNWSGLSNVVSRVLGVFPPTFVHFEQ